MAITCDLIKRSHSLDIHNQESIHIQIANDAIKKKKRKYNQEIDSSANKMEMKKGTYAAH